MYCRSSWGTVKLTDTLTGTTGLEPEQACRYAGGRLAFVGKRPIRGVVVDSRQACSDFLFVALPGERVDGHDFIRQAVEQGASAVLASRASWEQRRESLRELPVAGSPVSVILVEDSLTGLQRMAKGYLSRFNDCLRIGVTGSNGKTTTKEILGSIFARDRSTVISRGNLNSVIGLPVSCFNLEQVHRAAIFEMGINRPGEMDVLADIFRPDAAVITNIGGAHIGLLGSREGIAREKKKIFQYFDGTQRAFLFENEELQDILTKGIRAKLIRFGPESTRGFEGSEDLGLDGTIIHWEGLRVRFPLFGAHNLRNALAAISVSAELGICKEKIKEGLEAVQPLFGRSEITRGKVTILQDCYNANPDSFHQVFEFLSTLKWPGRKIAVLGAMKELGRQSREAHRQIVAEAGNSDFQGLFLFGEELEESFRQLGAGGFDGTAEWMTDIDSLRESLHSYLREGDLLLIKGSRAVELERLLPEPTEG